MLIFHVNFSKKNLSLLNIIYYLHLGFFFRWSLELATELGANPSSMQFDSNENFYTGSFKEVSYILDIIDQDVLFVQTFVLYLPCCQTIILVTRQDSLMDLV